MNVDSYLRRIGYRGNIKADLDTLRSLHRSHMKSVPFENLDIHLDKEIHLNEEILFEKIVRQRRGGFCYELNGLFARLLREIGFDVKLHSARVFQDGEPGPEFDHLTLVVHLDEPWLADVGFGDSFIEPLRVNEPGEQVQFETGYWLHRKDDEITLQRMKSGAIEEPQYVFNTHPHRLADFADMCKYHQTSPLSHFTRKRVCSLATLEGRITLSDNKLILNVNGARTERELSAADYFAALRQYFGITLDPSIPFVLPQSV